MICAISLERKTLDILSYHKLGHTQITWSGHQVTRGVRASGYCADNYSSGSYRSRIRLRQSNRERLRQFEALYVQRYWSILDQLSLEALAGLSAGSPYEGDLKAVRAYMLLCEDELEMRGRGYIADSTYLRAATPRLRPSGSITLLLLRCIASALTRKGSGYRCRKLRQALLGISPLVEAHQHPDS